MTAANKKFSWKKRALSFRYAAKGIRLVLQNEHNAWIHTAALLAVVCTGFYFGISKTEWALIALASGMVLAAEAFNTAIEYLCNRVTTDPDEAIGKVKDIASGAVLLCAIAAATVGLIIFAPYISALFSF